MTLMEQWAALVENQKTKTAAEAFWKEYYAMEKDNYAKILEDTSWVPAGTVKDLAEKFNMEPGIFAGFLDGINTSLKKELDLEALTEESEITLDIDFEKLYYNMLDAKADWLYNLPQWDNVLTQERRKEITKEYRSSKIAVSNKVGRNEPCPCGSGKKYKKCCGA